MTTPFPYQCKACGGSEAGCCNKDIDYHPFAGYAHGVQHPDSCLGGHEGCWQEMCVVVLQDGTPMAGWYDGFGQVFALEPWESKEMRAYLREVHIHLGALGQWRLECEGLERHAKKPGKKQAKKEIVYPRKPTFPDDVDELPVVTDKIYLPEQFKDQAKDLETCNDHADRFYLTKQNLVLAGDIYCRSCWEDKCEGEGTKHTLPPLPYEIENDRLEESKKWDAFLRIWAADKADIGDPKAVARASELELSAADATRIGAAFMKLGTDTLAVRKKWDAYLEVYDALNDYAELETRPIPIEVAEASKGALTLDEVTACWYGQHVFSTEIFVPDGLGVTPDTDEEGEDEDSEHDEGKRLEKKQAHATTTK